MEKWMVILLNDMSSLKNIGIILLLSGLIFLVCRKLFEVVGGIFGLIPFLCSTFALLLVLSCSIVATGNIVKKEVAKEMVVMKTEAQKSVISMFGGEENMHRAANGLKMIEEANTTLNNISEIDGLEDLKELSTFWDYAFKF